MRRLIGAEVHKLVSTRSGTAMLCAPIVYPAVVSALTKASGTAESGSDAIDVLRGTGDVLPVIWMLVGALSVAGEFRDGSIVSTLIAVPQRSTLFTAKLAALALVSVITTALAVSVALGSAAVAEPSTWLDSVGGWDLVGTTSALFVVSVLFVLIGGSVGEIARNPTVSSVGILVWMLVAENALPTALGFQGATGWMSSRSAMAVVDVARPDPDAIAAGAGLAVLSVIAAVVGTVAVVVFERRDIAV